jgi:diacylglycerol kinase family enzyme
MPNSITIVANAESGSASETDRGTLLRESLGRAGVAADVRLAGGGEEITTLVREAIERGSTMVVAAGGDGTVNAVASGLMDTGVMLGVLPLGTLNHFAKDLGIPLELDQAVEVLASGQPRLVDVGEVNGRIFLNNSSLGLYPHMVGHRRRQQRLGRNKWVALVWSALTMLGRYPSLRVSVTADGAEKVITTPLVFIGNNEYEIHGLEIGTRRRLNGGELSLYLPHHVGRAGLLMLAARALVGLLRDAAGFDATCAESILIETGTDRVRVALDGEIVTMETPLHYRIRPEALGVMAPIPEASEEKESEAEAAAMVPA